MAPTRAPRFCAAPMCGVLVRAGRCPAHGGPRRPWQHAQPSRHARGYGYQWEKLRAQVLSEEPWCALCGRPSTTVDHIKAKAEGGGDERSNLRGLCAECQARKAGAEGAAARRRPPIRQLLPDRWTAPQPSSRARRLLNRAAGGGNGLHLKAQGRHG
jgi:5-methylcytosine-specific restriction enzyme A